MIRRPPRSTLLSLHDALPISSPSSRSSPGGVNVQPTSTATSTDSFPTSSDGSAKSKSKRSEEHTSELQSRLHLVCRLLLEKKKKGRKRPHPRRARWPTASLPR